MKVSEVSKSNIERILLIGIHISIVVKCRRVSLNSRLFLAFLFPIVLYHSGCEPQRILEHYEYFTD
jgi:hypothetical protein